MKFSYLLSFSNDLIIYICYVHHLNNTKIKMFFHDSPNNIKIDITPDHTTSKYLPLKNLQHLGQIPCMSDVRMVVDSWATHVPSDQLGILGQNRWLHPLRRIVCSDSCLVISIFRFRRGLPWFIVSSSEQAVRLPRKQTVKVPVGENQFASEAQTLEHGGIGQKQKNTTHGTSSGPWLSWLPLLFEGWEVQTVGMHTMDLFEEGGGQCPHSLNCLLKFHLISAEVFVFISFRISFTLWILSLCLFLPFFPSSLAVT